MNAYRIIFLISIGGLLEASIRTIEHEHYSGLLLWSVFAVISLFGWGGTTAASAFRTLQGRAASFLTGRPQTLPATDPKAMAAELAALNAQIAQLRDTATSFDVSFDQTLHRMDERLRRVEQQSAYVQTVRPQ